MHAGKAFKVVSGEKARAVQETLLLNSVNFLNSKFSYKKIAQLL